MTKKQSIERAYGFPFPDHFFAFAEFWKKHGTRCAEALGVAVVGPFDVLEGKMPHDRDGWPRFYRDPPEFFTAMIGDTDGLHWGYWFDDPGKMEPVIATYYHNDAFEMSEHTTLFDALRYDLELAHRDAEDYRESDPEYASDYEKRLERYARVREALAKFVPDEGVGMRYVNARMKVRSKRKTIATTRHRMGIVTTPKQYEPIGKKDPFDAWNYVPKKRDTKRMMEAARGLAERGKPGAALKLGHDLWGYSDFNEESAAMLDLAYGVLGRDILKGVLKDAVAFRKKCDTRR